VITAPVPVIDASVAMEPPAGTDVSAILLDAIADKTGYPIDMIDEEMELEADLGIDSIKRVEILSTVNIALGGVINKDNVEELSGIGKISDMVSFLNSISVSSVVTDPPAAGIDLNAIVIDAISDKTGYPTDMIESDMELEADLGIDSIKRVEIFSAIFTTLERTPSADEIGELSALTDIQSIVAYLADKT
jgi:acyl carrier protein